MFQQPSRCHLQFLRMLLRSCDHSQLCGSTESYTGHCVKHWEHHVPGSQYLAPVIGPLVGSNDTHIRNTQHFVEKIKNLEVPPPCKLVSYGMSALFTSFPTEEACKVHVIREILETDMSLKSRCSVEVI